MAIDPRQIARPAQFGTAQPAPALDPTGIVPVNRTQPVATDGAEAQRLMERRLGSMPPTSFSGSGAGFVPVDRAGIGQLPDRLTAMANMEQYARPQVMPQLSGEAMRRAALAQGLGPPSGANPRTNAVRDVVDAGRADAHSRLASREALQAQRVEDREARKAGRSIRRSALQERIAAMMAQRANGMGAGTPAGGLLGLKPDFRGR